MTTLTMPTREIVGLLGDVYPFASSDDEDTTWHRVVLRWDGSRLHAMAGNGYRLAWTSWGPDDGDQPEIPGLEYGADTGATWELAILPEDAKEIAKKFKVGVKLGEAPVRVTGSIDSIRVERDAEAGLGVALTSVSLARPWDDAAPVIDQAIAKVGDCTGGEQRASMGYSGAALADFCNPKVVRQRGLMELHFGPNTTYVKIGRWFRGAIVQAPSSDFTDRD